MRAVGCYNVHRPPHQLRRRDIRALCNATGKTIRMREENTGRFLDGTISRKSNARDSTNMLIRRLTSSYRTSCEARRSGHRPPQYDRRAPAREWTREPPAPQPGDAAMLPASPVYSFVSPIQPTGKLIFVSRPRGLARHFRTNVHATC